MSTIYDTYTVEISVPSTEFSEEGITLTDESFTAMLHNAFPYTRWSNLHARVLKPTNPKQIDALPDLIAALKNARELLCVLTTAGESIAEDMTVQQTTYALQKAGAL